MSAAPAAADPPPLPVLYHDDGCVVADKPSGLLVHRTPRTEDDVFLLQRLRDQLDRFVYPVQRLGRATSGAITFALSSEAARALQLSLTAPSCPQPDERCRH